MKRKRGILLAVLLVLILAAGLVFALLNFITDYLWFKEMGYTSVFFTKLLSQIKLGVPFFIVLTALTYLYLRLMKRDYEAKVEITGASVGDKTIRTVALVIAAAFSLFATLTTTSTLWYEIMSFLNKTEFQIEDPVFHMDVGEFIFTLPLANQVYSIAIGLVMFLAIITVLFFVFLISVRRPKVFESQYEEMYDATGGFIDGRTLAKKLASSNWRSLLRVARRQIVILAGLFFLILAAGYVLKQYQLLYNSGSVVYGAGFADINVSLWQYRALAVLSVISALLFGYGIMKGKLKTAFAAPVLMIAVGVLGTALSMGVQYFIVAPDEISKESEFIQNNIMMTQKAYGIDDIEESSFAAENNLSSEDIVKNRAIFENIRINDFEPTKQFYNQRQSIKQYYTFNDVDVDRYMINGEYTQVFLSAREIDESKINNQWITRHLKYTHGYGLTLSQVNSITASGQPDILIQNVPPESSVPEIQIERPEIYFGEMTNDYVIVNTDEEEFDYPLGESNIYTSYEGDAGIELNLINRVLFSIKERSMKMLVSTNIHSDSRILVYRNIQERMSKIAPFLYYDADPYLVTVDGKLYWMADAYTVSSYFPYSEPYVNGSYNYIRNSVKVVIDAYNGSVDYYIVDEEDPMVSTMAKIFPQLFKPLSEMPENLRQHIRYPKTLFEIQANVYKKYHMNDVNVFYQGEDLWDIANEIYGQEATQMTSNYYIMSLPGQTEEEFILSIPYTPVTRDNMTALLVARNDGEHYGEMICYRLPKGKTVYGPMQIESQIDQDTTISKEFSLWSQRGSTYLRGNIFVVPVEESLLYVEPIYLQAANESSLPEVKRVIAVYGNTIAYEETLGEALEVLFGKEIGDLAFVGEVDAVENGGTGTDQSGEEQGGESPGSGGIDMDASQEELIQNANQAFEEAVNAQRNGDWAGYGRYLEQLEQYLNALAGEEEASEEALLSDDAPPQE